MLIGHKYWVEISLEKKINLLHLKSNDISACYLVKRAASTRLGCDRPVVLDSDVFIENEVLLNVDYLYLLQKNCSHSLKNFFKIISNFNIYSNTGNN